MAVNPTPTTIQQNLPSPYIEGALTSLSERLLPLLSTSAAINTASYAPKVAGISQFTQASQQVLQVMNLSYNKHQLIQDHKHINNSCHLINNKL